MLLFVFGSFSALAQRTVSGKVTDTEGSGMPGVNVIVQGTSVGTTTDANGDYSINVSQDGATLVFSFIGYTTQEIPVGNRTSIDVTLVDDARQLSEVVVTALGIEREKKALQYSVTEVSGDKLTQARENSLANALAGRVAGVNVTKVNSGPAGSSRVVIRGAKSLQGGNQPLYVVDGIPMDNTNFGQAGMWGGGDQGDGMTSINPDDIASITVLKGASAAALYGFRASNGVILITTKKGTNRKGIGVEFNSNYVFETVNDVSDFQRDYGQGGYVRADATDPNSAYVNTAPTTQQQAMGWATNGWGPKFGEGPSEAVQFDGVVRPYAYAGDNWDRFYQTATSWTNTLALTGGGENQSFRFSYSDLNSEGVVPNSGFDRKNLSLSTNGKFGEKLTFNAKVMYSHEYAKNRPRLSDSPSNAILSLYYIPNNVNVNDYRGDPNKLGALPPGTPEDQLTLHQKGVGEEFQQVGPNNNWHQNPWWVAYQHIDDDRRDRIISSAQLRYDFTDWLYVSGRAGMDWFTRRDTNLTPQGTGHDRGGAISEGEDRVREINLEWIAGINKPLGDVNINVFVGGNKMTRSSERIAANGDNFNVPFFHAINNAATRNFGYGFSEYGVNSLFGSAEVSYKGFLYVTATARNDWFSVLNDDIDNEILYPSVGASFVFTDAMNTLPTWLSFGKVRATWAQVGNVGALGPYNTAILYSLGTSHLDNPTASFSGSGVPNLGLEPALSEEIEFGFDMRFFQNRLGVDFTYYSQVTTQDILDQTISRASGFPSTKVNVGEMRNKGIEVLLTGTPVVGDFTWEISLNLAKNNNEVVSLVDGATELLGDEPRTQTVRVKHMVGHPYNMITGLVQKRDPNGNLVFDAETGAPIQSSTFEILGNAIPDLTGGLTNSFTYKNFNLSALIDFKAGGDIYSGTEVRMTQAGFTKRTIAGREGQEPITISGVAETAPDVYEPFSMTLTPQQAQNYWSQLGNRAQENFMYDASFAKLRQVTFGYTFPRSILDRSPFQTLMLSFVGRNLALLYRNTENVDPEASYANGNSQGLDYFGMPATRTYGFNLRATF